MTNEEIARLFLDGAEVGENIDELLKNNSRMNLGIDPGKNVIVLTIGDEWEEMDLEFARFLSDALLMAVKTIDALKNARYN